MLKINNQNILKFINHAELKLEEEKAIESYKTLVNKNGLGNDFLGWIDYPINYDKEEYDRIKKAAQKIRNDSEVLVVIGIGGSYLGAKAVIEALKPYFKKEKDLEIIFAGNNLSASYMVELLKYLENKSFSLNVISKSGTTTEPAIAFRLLKELLIKKVGKVEASKRIYATTDKQKGALRTLANSEGYETFIVPDDIGGRYSWFTAVGLLPIAAAGFDIDQLMKGSIDSRSDALSLDFKNSPFLQYACYRHLLGTKKGIEILVSFEPKLAYLAEWWKQLYGESEGKENKGIYPASLIYSTDLHSMGQFVQEGSRLMFETVLNIKQPNSDMKMAKEEVDLDGLNYLEGVNLDYVSKMAMEGTILAHVDGGVPNLVIEVDKIDEYNLGYLLYFFMFSCGITCYMSGINPFNQPGVESYKKNMFALLNKPGYEELRKALLKK